MCLDLRHPRLHEVLGQPLSADGSISWKHPSGRLRASLAVAIGPDRDGHRDLVIRFDAQDPYQKRQVVPLSRVRCGFHWCWLAVCGCGHRARKLYLAEGPQLTCWRCAGLQYSSAQQHDSRLDTIRGNLGDLEVAARNLKCPTLAGRACELGMKTLQQAERDLHSRSPKRRRKAACCPAHHRC